MPTDNICPPKSRVLYGVANYFIQFGKIKKTINEKYILFN